MLNYRYVPVFINSFNVRSSLELLVDWLTGAGYRNIIIIDNASTYAPLLQYLAKLERNRVARIVRLSENVGHLALWQSKILEQLGITSEYVYSDPDIVPAESCRGDIVREMQEILVSNPRVNKVGLGLCIDDLPICYAPRATVVAWELQFWRNPAGCGLFNAPVDTTFALYRANSGQTLETCIRTGWPNLARHTAWYSNSEAPSEEERQYRLAARSGVSNWAVEQVPDWLREGAQAVSASAPRLVQFGCWPRAMPAFEAGFDLEPHAGFDGIYVEHGEPLGALPEKLAAFARPGARCVIHAYAGDGWEKALGRWRDAGWAPERVLRVEGPAVPARHRRTIFTFLRAGEGDDVDLPISVTQTTETADLDVTFAARAAA